MNEFYLNQIDTAMNALADRCAVLLEQRNEARRMYCHAVSGGTVTPAKIAHQNGWDCFDNPSEN